jgi:5-methylcytosine-specific restriction endonuclease McrA
MQEPHLMTTPEPTHKQSYLLLPNDQRQAFLRLYDRYQSGADKRGLVFELSRDEFHVIVSSSCHYCGDPPRSEGDNIFPHVGVDRKHNKKGYSLFNSLPCCSICNFAKGQRSYEVFLAYITRVAKNRANVAHLFVQNRSASKEVVAEFERLCVTSS